MYLLSTEYTQDRYEFNWILVNLVVFSLVSIWGPTKVTYMGGCRAARWLIWLRRLELDEDEDLNSVNSLVFLSAYFSEYDHTPTVVVSSSMSF